MRSRLTTAVDLSVVITAYNEERQIEASLRLTLAFLERRGGSWEILIADDGSTDRTATIVSGIERERPEVRLVRLPRNRGKGTAMKAGVAESRGRRVLVMDADLSTPLHEIERLSLALDAGAAVAIGSRAVAGADVRRPQGPLRTWLGRAGNLWIQLLAVPGVKDTQCGFKLFDGALARRLFPLCQEDRFAIDVELLCLARRGFGVHVAEVGVAWEHRDGSKVRWHDYLDTLGAVPRVALSVWRKPSTRGVMNRS